MKPNPTLLLSTLFILGFAFLSYPSPTSHRVFESVVSTLRSARNLAQVVSATMTVPELPRVYVDTSMPSQAGATITAPNSAAFQTALNTAQPGDTIVLNAGTTYTGTFNLPNKTNPNNKWIVIKTNQESSLPPEGTRVSPSHAQYMPLLTITGSNSPVITNSSGAGYYRFIGVEMTLPTSITYVHNALVALNPPGGLSTTPHHIVFDRTYVHGQDNVKLQRCFLLNASDVAVIDSYVSKCNSLGQDSQAIAVWNSPGPFKIVNNFLEGSHENVMFGGADSASPQQIPSDIEIRNNYFWKDPSRVLAANYQVKNLLEFKVGIRILVEGNILENNWADNQNGTAIVIKSVNQNNSAPWSETRDLTFRYNIVRNVAHAMAIAGHPESYTVTNPTSKVYVGYNSFEKVGDGTYPGGRLWVVSGVNDATFEFNTGFGLTQGLYLNYPKMNNLYVADNVFGTSQTNFGSWNFAVSSSDGYGYGTAALNGDTSSWTFVRNVMPSGVTLATFPSGNFNTYPASTGSAGVNMATLSQKTSGSISGSWSGGQVYVPPPVVTPPTPTLTLTASQSSITLGQSVTLTWSTTNATSCTASGGWSGSAALSGSQSVTPNQTTTYTLICGSASQAVTITVSVPPSTPPITTPPPPVTITPPTTTPAPTTPNVGNGMNDTFPPSIPDRLTAFTSHAGELTVRWDPSFDRGGIGGYKVYRDSAQVSDTPKEEYIDKGLTPNQSYTYSVSAYDRSGNSSSQSSSRTFKVDGSITTPTVVTPTQTSTPTFSFTKNLRYGQENSDVLALQTKLKSLGYFSASVTPNGYFGRQTLTAVIKYQRAMGLSTTGFVGPMTRGRLSAN